MMTRNQAPEKIPDKAKTLFHLSQCIFYLEYSKGHLRWKVTDLVRKAGVSRTLVYRYLGGSKGEILMSAFRIFSNRFYGFDERDRTLTLVQRIERARETVYANPEAIIFYQIWRVRPSTLQKEFMEIEKKFQRQLKKIFPHLDSEQLLAVHACIHGLVTSPFLSPAQAAQTCRALEEMSVFSRPSSLKKS